MTDYLDGWTPTTEDVRQRWISAAPPRRGEGEFDRWLAEHDRAVAEAAWARGFCDAEADILGHITFNEPCRENPYRKETSA